MGWIFSPGSDRKLRLALVGVAVLVFGIPLSLLAWVRTPYITEAGRLVEQPVPFDHRHHVADDGIDCVYCHSTVLKAPSAGMPSTARCMGCHGQIWNQSPLLEPVRASFFSGRPIPWVRVTRLPDFVYFDHSIHVRNGVGCETCHGRIDRMPVVHQAAPLTMGWCLDCHRNPGPHLRPTAAITVMGWKSPRPTEGAEGAPTVALGSGASAEQERAAAVGGALGMAPKVGPTYCTACHR